MWPNDPKVIAFDSWVPGFLSGLLTGSEMPQQDDEASEVNEAEEVLGLPLPASHDASELLEPSEDSLDLPSPLVATQSSSVLLPSTSADNAARRNKVDVSFAETVGELAAVEAFVRDEVRRELFDPGRVEGRVDEGDVVFRTIRDANGDWKTSAVCKRHDLCRIAGAASADTGAPFLAPA